LATIGGGGREIDYLVRQARDYGAILSVAFMLG
jgi:hypothetical protein